MVCHWLLFFLSCCWEITRVSGKPFSIELMTSPDYTFCIFKYITIPHPFLECTAVVWSILLNSLFFAMICGVDFFFVIALWSGYLGFKWYFRQNAFNWLFFVHFNDTHMYIVKLRNGTVKRQLKYVMKKRKKHLLLQKGHEIWFVPWDIGRSPQGAVRGETLGTRLSLVLLSLRFYNIFGSC